LNEAEELLSNLDTKTRIMDVAEKLFAERGYAATSLRDITGEAEANLAAVNYHFQSKEGLLSAILERYVGPVNRERLETLDTIEARVGKGPPDLEELLEAFLGPAFSRRRERGADGARFMRLAGRMHSETDDHLRSILLSQFQEVARRFSRAFRRALPHLDENEVHLRTHFLVGAMAHTLLWCENMPGPPFGRRKTVPPVEALESLVRFAAGGLAAPAPPGGKPGNQTEAKR
jgi:AcrR family transcriptional regulator